MLELDLCCCGCYVKTSLLYIYTILFLPPAITSCLPLSIGSNILSDASNNISIGSVVHFNCRVDFTMIGNSIALCQADGTWNTTVPTCAASRQATTNGRL